MHRDLLLWHLLYTWRPPRRLATIQVIFDSVYVLGCLMTWEA